MKQQSEKNIWIKRRLRTIIHFARVALGFISQNIYYKRTFTLYQHKYLKDIESVVSIRLVDSGNVADILDFQSSKHATRFNEFLKKGCKGYYAYINNKCVHHSWVRPPLQKVQLHWAVSYELSPNEYYISHCSTAPEARGSGIYPFVLTCIVKNLEQGKKILISTEESNYASCRGIEKAGFVKIAQINVKIILTRKSIQWIKLPN